MIVKEKNGEGFLDLRICDNLELMAEIKDNTIDLIYCDILYGTGRKFKDYQDLKPIRSEIETHYISRKKRCTGIIFIDGALRLYMDYKNSIVLTVEPNNTAYYSNYYIMFTTLKEAEAHQKKLIQEAVDKESELIMEKLREIHALREMLQE